MSKIIEALKALYVKLGGTASTVADVTQTPDMINAIAGLDIGGGGSSLPAVTSDDNGSVLTVVEGEWDKAEAPSGNNDFVVTYIEDSGTVTADKTFAEITAAYNAGKKIYAKYQSYVVFIPLITIDEHNDEIVAFGFAATLWYDTETSAFVNIAIVHESNNIAIYQ